MKVDAEKGIRVGANDKIVDPRTGKVIYAGEAGASGPAKYKAKDTYERDGKSYHMWYDEEGGVHKTDVLAESPDGKPTNFEPPNAGEREAAVALVDKDETLSDLGSDDEAIAAEILANDIRQLQASGFDYADAAIMATEKLKRKIKDVPGFFGSYKELDLGDGGLAENEYFEDGVVYIRDGNGNWSRKP